MDAAEKTVSKNQVTMGLFEWLGESFNPGPTGNIQRHENASWQPKSKFTTWLFTLLGLGIFGFLAWCILQSDAIWQWTLALLIYLIIAWVASPRPDYRNMGWAGGLLDNPFRISDDYNRMLSLLALLLVPGKLIIYAAQTLLNTIRAR